MKLSRELFEEYWEPVVRTNLTLHQQSFVPEEIFRNKNITYSLSREDKRVIDHDHFSGKCYHDHFSGKYVCIAHDACNLKRRTKPGLVVVIHNANYDFIQLLPKLLKKYGVKYETTCIPKTNQKFLTLTMTLCLEREIIMTKSGKRLGTLNFQLHLWTH